MIKYHRRKERERALATRGILPLRRAKNKNHGIELLNII